MDQFLPGDIATMVLRYLAASGCEDSVMTMIREMPFMSYYVPPRPPGLSTTQYVKLLSRPSLTPGLSDLLNDYAKSKFMVSSIIQAQNPGASPLQQCDSMFTQLRQLNDVVNKRVAGAGAGAVQYPQPPLTQSASTSTQGSPSLLDVGINSENKKFAAADGETQTEELLASTREASEAGSEVQRSEVQTGDVPLRFYHSLMSDVSIPEKFASAINKHFKETSTANEVLEKVGPSAETEIDKFMTELFGDENYSNSISDTLPQLGPQPPNLSEGFTNMFRDADSLICKDDVNIDNVSSVVVVTTENKASSKKLFETNNDTAKQPPVPVKRIIPTPAPTLTPRPNPVFEFQEKPSVRVVPSPGQGLPYTVRGVITAPNLTAWEKLGRRSIAPKLDAPKTITLSAPSTHTTQVQKSSQKKVASCSKRKSKFSTPIKMTPEKAKTADFFVVYHDKVKESGEISTIASAQPKSPEKPKAVETIEDYTPKLVLVTVSPSPKTTSETPVNQQANNVTYQTPVERLENNEILHLEAEKVAEVTPQLNEPPAAVINQVSSSRGNRIISPQLSRLISTAQKMKAASTAAQLPLARKCFSTPRKKKHVRNLFLDTPPPALKAVNNSSPGSHMILRGKTAHTASFSVPHKRKAEETLSPEMNTRSKKRLEWNEGFAEGYKSEAFPDRNFTYKLINEGMPLSAVKVVHTNSPLKTSTGVSAADSKLLPHIPEEQSFDESHNNNMSSFADSTPNTSHNEISVVDEVDSEEVPVAQEISVEEEKEKEEKENDVEIPLVAPPLPPNAEYIPPQLLESCPMPIPPALAKRLEIGSVQVEANTSKTSSTSERRKSGSSRERRKSEDKSKDKRDNHYHRHESKSAKSRRKSTKYNDLFGTDNSSSSEEGEVKPKKKSHHSSTSSSTTVNRRSKEKDAKAKKEPPPTDSRRPQRVAHAPQTSTKSPRKTQQPKLITPPNKKPSPRVVKKSGGGEKQTRDESPPTPQNHRKSRRLDVRAAQSVVDAAVPLGRSSARKSPRKTVKSPIKQAVLPTHQNTATTDSTIPLSHPPPEIMTIHSVPQATPVKEPPPLPFNIVPAPIGFPDPTPVKYSRNSSDLQQNSLDPFFGASQQTLITPMKTRFISPPSLPPTPRYMVHDVETDSNSLGNFSVFCRGPSAEDSPFKLGLPPTPGRSMFADERNQTVFIKALQQPSPETALAVLASPARAVPASPARAVPASPARAPIPCVNVSLSRSNNFNFTVSKIPEISEFQSFTNTTPSQGGHFQVPKQVHNKQMSPEKRAENLLKETTNLSTGLNGMTVFVEGTKKCLVQSEERTIISPDKVFKMPDPTPSKKEVPKPSGSAALRNLLKTVDLHKFLREVHQRNTQTHT